MSTYLIKTEEIYRADTEAEATKLIEDAKNDNRYTLGKYVSTAKAIKAKGEIIEEYMQVKLTKIFDEEKMPIGCTTIEYNTTGNNF